MLLSLKIKLLAGIKATCRSLEFIHLSRMENLIEDFSANERK